jgi:hypothetical protein
MNRNALLAAVFLWLLAVGCAKKTNQPTILIDPLPTGNAVSPDWEKFDPAVTSFTNADGKVCKDGGNDKDRTTYRYNDRSDTAEDHGTSYHPVSLSAVKALPYFVNEHASALDGFTNPDDKKEVFKYPGHSCSVGALARGRPS